MLVDVQQLAQHLGDPQWTIFDCRFTLTDKEAGRRAYLVSHIPGACYVHLEEDLSGEISGSSGRHPLPDPHNLSEKLGCWGVDETKQVVVYDDSFGAMATRMWWLLRWLGHENVALLDGGVSRWKRAQLPLTAERAEPVPTIFRPRIDDGMRADTAAVMEALASRDMRLIDARAEERFLGDFEPLDRVAGHIPGAVNHPFEDNLADDGTFLSPEQLRAIWLKTMHGVSSAKTIHMCGSGVTACHNLLALEIAGLKGGRLYPGSWSEWITDETRPMATGEG